jgi:hypothetical protein
MKLALGDRSRWSFFTHRFVLVSLSVAPGRAPLLADGPRRSMFPYYISCKDALNSRILDNSIAICSICMSSCLFIN